MVVQQSCTVIKVFHYNFSQEVGLDPLFTDTDVPGQYGGTLASEKHLLLIQLMKPAR
jgi:hypothetical protein